MNVTTSMEMHIDASVGLIANVNVNVNVNKCKRESEFMDTKMDYSMDPSV